MLAVADRITNRVQLAADGLKAYLVAVPNALGDDVDFAQLLNTYGPEIIGPGRYSPPVCIGAECHAIIGEPEHKHVSTSYVERQNLTMRIGMRRFTRLTNGFSKKVENHESTIALHFMHQNFCRIHTTLRVTPAMEAGLASHVWQIADLPALVEKREAEAIAAGSMKRGSYQKAD